MKLKDVTRELLINRPKPLTLAIIERDLNITQNWLSRFAQDKMTFVDVDNCQLLFEYLSKTKLNLNGFAYNDKVSH